MSRLTEPQEDALAAEFVLGTLHGRARTRFMRLLMTDDRLRKKIWQWETQLNQLSEALPEKSPDPQVWLRIRQLLNFNVTAVPIDRAREDKTIKSAKPWPRWLPVSLSAAALLLVLIFNIPSIIQSPPSPAEIAVVQNTQAQALWLIRLQENNLSVTATQQVESITDKDYELWLVAADGRAPVSLGLLPKQGASTLPRPELFDEVTVAALAVSLEPIGGSPTGSPTEVLFTAQLVRL